ncbi:hypothetical protein KA005_36545 [bacterium]|nr:hypothetical protein [bacterium]
MIIYHPAHDINHCAFRFINLLSDVEQNQLDWQTLQILDFYYVFPHLLADIRLPRNQVATKRHLKSIPTTYESLPNARRLMFGLKALHNETARALVAKGILNKEPFLRNIIKLDIYKIPATLSCQIEDNTKRNTQWYKLLVQVLAGYPLNGKDGLKNRTQLMEFRYDPT